MATFRTKLPSGQDCIPVFSTVLFIVFSWSIYRISWQLPSWLYFLDIWDILVVVAYILAFALFESLAMMGLLLFLSIILPSKYFRDRFLVQGSVTIWMLALWAILLQKNIGFLYYAQNFWEYFIYIPLLLMVIAISISAVSYAVIKIEVASNYMRVIADRMTIFLYIYGPLSILSLAAVVARNLF